MIYIYQKDTLYLCFANISQWTKMYMCVFELCTVPLTHWPKFSVHLKLGSDRVLLINHSVLEEQLFSWLVETMKLPSLRWKDHCSLTAMWALRSVLFFPVFDDSSRDWNKNVEIERGCNQVRLWTNLVIFFSWDLKVLFDLLAPPKLWRNRSDSGGYNICGDDCNNDQQRVS